MHAPESLYPSSLLRSEDSNYHLPSSRFSWFVSSKLKLWTAAPYLSLGPLEQVWCRIRLTVLVSNGGWQGYLMMLWSHVAECFWRCIYYGRTTLRSGVGEVRCALLCGAVRSGLLQGSFRKRRSIMRTERRELCVCNCGWSTVTSCLPKSNGSPAQGV